MYTDLLLAIAHHILIFALAGIIAAELVLVRPGLKSRDYREAGTHRWRLWDDRHADHRDRHRARVLRPERLGILLYYWAFWAKMVAFAIVGLLSIQPTMRFIAWRKAAGDPAFAVPEADLRSRAPPACPGDVFLLIPVFAAIMARGIGY